MRIVSLLETSSTWKRNNGRSLKIGGNKHRREIEEKFKMRNLMYFQFNKFSFFLEQMFSVWLQKSESMLSIENTKNVKVSFYDS